MNVRSQLPIQCSPAKATAIPMTTSHFAASLVTRLLQRLADGEHAALDDLIAASSNRLQQLARQMLNRFAGVRRWEQTDDIFQNSLLRLIRSLEDVKPQNSAQFLSLAALQIRRELLDLARHYFGPLGHGARHAEWVGDSDNPTLDRPDSGVDPTQLVEWRELHERVDELPDPLREVVSLLYYHGLTQIEAAELIRVNVRTVQRRWQAALLELHRTLKDEQPVDV